MESLKVKIAGKDYKIKITLGFWKKCGFTREQAEIISTDTEKYSRALKLSVFYGNKQEFNWECEEDMFKNIPESSFDDIDEDCADLISRAMIHYLPEKMRKVILAKINKTEEQLGEIIDNALDQALDQEKKSQLAGKGTSLS